MGGFLEIIALCNILTVHLLIIPKLSSGECLKFTNFTKKAGDGKGVRQVAEPKFTLPLWYNGTHYDYIDFATKDTTACVDKLDKICKQIDLEAFREVSAQLRGGDMVRLTSYRSSLNLCRHWPFSV